MVFKVSDMLLVTDLIAMNLFNENGIVLLNADGTTNSDCLVGDCKLHLVGWQSHKWVLQQQATTLRVLKPTRFTISHHPWKPPASC